MKRYALFEGDDYYPDGGWDDFTGWFDTQEEAVYFATAQDWAHVIDLQTGKKVWSRGEEE